MNGLLSIRNKTKLFCKFKCFVSTCTNNNIWQQMKQTRISKMCVGRKKYNNKLLSTLPLDFKKQSRNPKPNPSFNRIVLSI